MVKRSEKLKSHNSDIFWVSFRAPDCNFRDHDYPIQLNIDSVTP